MKCETPARRSSSRREPPANIKTTLVEWRSGIGSTTRRAPPGSAWTLRAESMGNRSIGSLLMWAFPQGPQRCVEGHRDEVGRHAVRDRVQRLTQVAPYVRYGVHLTQLT